MQLHLNARKLRLESLEERALLAVIAGGIEQTAALPEPADATAWIVNTTADPASWDKTDDVLSLREAIGRAQIGDMITFDDGLVGGKITLSGSQLKITRGITIDASSIGGITIDAADQSRVFYVTGGDETDPVELISLTVTGGNVSGNGGGIYNSGTLMVTGSTILGNTATSYGGGICNSNGTLTVLNSNISGNSANYGGGIRNNGTLEVIDTIISMNTTSNYGGGINNSGTMTLTDSTISGNSANINGGGTYNYNGTMTVTGSTISGNIADNGGGIWNNSTLAMIGTTISENTANTHGGGINNSGTLTVANCTVFGNATSGYYGHGGGIDNSGTLTLKNSTVSGNTASGYYAYGGGIYNSSRQAFTNTIVTLNYARNQTNVSGSYSGSNNIIGVDPGFVVAPVFENGKLVNADELDLSLAAESIAIDRGTNDAVETETDVARNPRIVAAWRETPTVDIGAYEYQERVDRTTVVTTAFDIVDETDGLISLREAILNAGLGQTIVFDASLAGETIILNGTQLEINKGITIDATSIGGITIDAYEQSRVLYIKGGDKICPVQLIGLTVRGGWTEDNGGGIYIQSGVVEIADTTVSGNAANNYGGGIYKSAGALAVTNSTIAGNAATSSGGGVYNYSSGTLAVTNTIVSLNYSKNTPNLYSNSSYSGSNNVIGVDPGFAVAPVFKNGKLVNADELDLSLTAESIAIDRGTNDVVETETDVAGNPRIVVAWRETPTVDIGAYEYQERVDRTTVVTTSLDFVDENDGLISLREAILNAVLGETITFDAALIGETIVLNGSQLEIHEKITIDAASIGGITIDANGKSRVFYIEGGDEIDPVQLTGLAIKGGCVNGDGGGIYIESGVVEITDSTVSGNSTSGDYANGGGICNNSGTLTVTNSTVSGNSTSGNYTNGGGICNNSGTLTVTNSTVSGNTVSGNGGGIYSKGTLTLTETTITGNTASYYGGGIYDSGTLALIDSTVSGNSTLRYGGGICNYGSLTVMGSTISENFVRYYDGGGIYNYGTITLTNSTVSKNSARNDEGGGIYNSGTLTLTNTAVSGNTANSDGGGIYTKGTLTLTNSTVSGNAANSNGGGIYNSDGTLTLTNTVLAFNYASLNTDLYSDCSYSSSYNIIGFDPGFVVVPVFENGKLVNADELDLSLAKGGVAIDAGLNSAVTTETDIAGNPRIVDWFVDIGAYEYQSGSESETPSTVVTTTLDIVNGADNQISLREAILYAAAGDTVTFDDSLAGETITLNGTQLVINKGMTIDATSIGGITIDADGKSRVFYIVGVNAANPIKLIGLTVTGGRASDDGAGIYNNSGTLTVMNSTVSGNTASGNGGGIYSYNGTLTVTDSVISGNTAKFGGGIRDNGTMTLTNSTVSGNIADYGGGIYNSTGTVTLTNTIVSLNYAKYYADITTTTYSGSNILVGVDPGFVVAPVFEAGALVNLDDLDLSLTSWSVAIDAGLNSAVTTATDITGNPRIVAAWREPATVDIGAYEYQECVERSTVVTTALDIVDGTDGLISLREAILYATAGDVVTFDDSLAGSSITLNGTQLEIGKGITIDATSIGGITIDANGKSRVIYIAGGNEENPVGLIGLTVFGGNTASGNGGGIYNSGTLAITNLTVAGNTASGDGGGIYNSGALAITNSTVSGNAAEIGGGIYNSTGAVSLTNSILSFNYAESYSDINTSYFGSNNVVSFDPGFTVAPLFENGKLVNAEELDLSPADGSIAIDAGLNSAVTTETDIAGNLRIVNGVVDIGAYEYQGGTESETLETPAILTGTRGVYVSYGANRHYIQWDAVTEASGYEVQYTVDGSSWISVSASDTAVLIYGLTYGADVTYRVRALGEGSYTDSDWSGVKTFNVCPMDVNGDGDIGGLDRNMIAVSWGSEEGESEYRYYADINADGDVSGLDRNFLGTNWGAETGDDGLVYPRLLRAADAIFTAYASGKLDIDLDIF